MFKVNDDLSIYCTRGDTAVFGVTAEANGSAYKFLNGDIIRIKVFEKKSCENMVLTKEFPVAEETEKVNIVLESNETKFGEVISKPKDYWYEIEHERDGVIQTIIGYDEDGAKVFKLFPEGEVEA